MINFETKTEQNGPACTLMNQKITMSPFCIILFGGAGDLSQRMLLPAMFHLYADNLVKEFSLIAVGIPGYTDDQYRALVRESIQRFLPAPIDKKRCEEFLGHIHYLTGELDGDDVYTKICEVVHNTSPFLDTEDSNLVYYCAVQPSLFPAIARQLKKHSICSGVFNTKIVIEKPFGLDRYSSLTLNRLLLDVFNEKQIYRIDHYLGKDTVQNIIFFRFGNSIFEPLWNRRYIDHVQITVAENIGIEHRGTLYEQMGVVRDVVQNHVLQVLSLVAMEPPIGFDAELIRDERGKLLRTVRVLSESEAVKNVVLGQYGPGIMDDIAVPGYRQEEGVSPTSKSPTFFAGVFYIDNWRWSGIPFYIRAGKRLAAKASEVYVQFKTPPLQLFKEECKELMPNALTLSIQPKEEISLRISVRQSGITANPYPVDMKFSYSDTIGSHLSYENQIIDFMQGNLMNFSRQEGVEARWSIVEPILKSWEKTSEKNIPNYPCGSWGPDAARELIERDGRQWHTPI